MRISPLTDALGYYNLSYKCSNCGITIIYPKYLEKDFVMKCPKCLTRAMISGRKKGNVKKRKWNPTER